MCHQLHLVVNMLTNKLCKISKKLFFKFVCSVLVHVCVFTHAYMWKSEINISIFSIALHLIFGGRVSLLAWSSPYCRTSWPASSGDPPFSGPSSLLSLNPGGLQTCTTWHLNFMWMLRIQTWVFLLTASISPSEPPPQWLKKHFNKAPSFQRLNMYGVAIIFLMNTARYNHH